jgi:LDH2 family malate/lactate/ureidoglycolate dehydrogenase
MTLYPGTEKERRIRPDALNDIVKEIFENCGMSTDHAGTVADSLVDADLHGVHSHGVMRVPAYVARVTGRGVDPKGQPKLVKDAGAAMVVDGGNAMGQIGCTFAMRKAIERAKSTGIAAAALGHSNHCGAMYYYSKMALTEDMIGIAMTNALPTMAPWGGIDKLVGMNPMAVAFPALKEKPFVLDIAFAASALGRMVVYKQKGLKLPPGWAFDKEGRPTVDPDEALAGIVAPIGEHKGVGLAMMAGILSSLLSGSGYGAESGTPEKGPIPGKDAQFFMALNIGVFEDIGRFKERMDGIIRQVHASRLRPGFDRVYVPGEIEEELAARYRTEGIPLNDETLHGVVEAAKARGVDAAAIA